MSPEMVMIGKQEDVSEGCDADPPGDEPGEFPADSAAWALLVPSRDKNWRVPIRSRAIAELACGVVSPAIESPGER
jgi:hypothetical protein